MVAPKKTYEFQLQISTATLFTHIPGFGEMTISQVSLTLHIHTAEPKNYISTEVLHTANEY